MNAIYSTSRKFRRMIVNLLGILVILAIVLSATGGVFAQETDPPESIKYVVNAIDDNDDGTCDESHCSLREAINAANDNLAADMITFDIPGEGPFTIQPLSGLPEITDPVTIDGTTQPGFAGTPVVELDGSSAGEEVIGMVITAGDSTVRGLVINRFSASGILLWGNGGNTIEGNFLGTDTSGAFALGNAFDGVSIGESPDNAIEGNVISGSGGSGISMAGASATGNMIRGNLIGTNSNGSAALPNFDGVWLGESTSNNTIGGTITGEGNLISGNTIFGISVNAQASANLILGNFIGTDKTGTERLGNNAGGVFLSQGSFDNAIGGTQEGAGNLISGNGGNGVTIVDPGTTGNTVQGNLIGTDVTGTTATGPPGPAPGPFTVTALSETCPTYPEGTDFDGFVSESDDPLAPWSGTSVHFVGTEECGSPEKLGEASLIYRYRIEFDDVTPLTSIALSGAAFNGPDSILRVLDENMDVLGSVDTFGGNSFQVPFITLDDVEGKVFYVDEFDTSSTWRFRRSIAVNGPLPLGNLGNGVNLASGASGNLIGGADPAARNLISGNFANGVGIFNPGTTGNRVQGNFIGTDLSGTQALGNFAPGVGIGDQAFDNLIGGADPGAGNLISGNMSDGVALFDPGTNGNRLQGNRIGTDASGNAALPNIGVGVWIGVGAADTLVGGIDEGAGNLISGNAGDGVSINDAETTGIVVQGNRIGTDLAGTAAVPNGSNGVILVNGTHDNLLGGTDERAGNLISGNMADGVAIFDPGTNGNTVQGNLIGTDASGTRALGNAYRGLIVASGAAGNLVGGTEGNARNLISTNGAAGVRLTDFGTTGNRVQGNFIGTDLSGAAPLGNGYVGVRVSDGAGDNVIGGTEANAGNLISANRDSGVLIDGDGTTGNTVQGNLIGTDVTGSTAMSPEGPDPGTFTITPVEEICPTYPEGTDFDGFVSESDDPLAPWSGTSVHFVGTDECGSPEMVGEASLIYRYKLEFNDPTQLTSVAVSGAAFNGPDSVLRVLDEDMNVLGSVDTFGGNSFQVPFITLDDVEGKVFYVDEFDTSSTWRFRQSIVVNGSLPLGNLGSGVLLGGGASDNLIGGADPGAGNLISGSRFDGVALFGPETTDNKVQGNLIGTDADGTAALPNGAGVWIGDGALNTLVGGIDEGAGNLISGNAGDGVSINHPETTGTRVLGNYIGTDRSGDAALPNGAGGVFISASQTWIGGAEPGAGNVISGNAGSGIDFTEGASGNFVQGNYIGTDASGMNSLGNAFNGIFIGDGSTGITIGGIDPGEGNTIAFNGGTGIGTSMEAGQGNTFLSNSVFLNGGLGIDLGEDGVTPNDPGDSDEGPNELQNFPFLSPPVAVGGSVRVTGVLWSTPRTSYRIEFFSVMTCDESGYGEGDTFLGFRKVTAGASGFAPFVFPLPRDFSLDAFVTATATDPSGNTSEFSQCVGPAK